MPEDFPYEYVPGGRDYRWRDQYYSVPFYPQLPTERSLFKMPEEKKHPAEMRDSGPVPTLWGVTARVSYALSVLLREGRENFS